MKYVEWNDLEIKKDKDNPLMDMYCFNDGSTFFIEPAFYTQLTFLKNIHEDRYHEIIEEMNRVVKKNKHVIFTHDYEHPFVIKDDYILLEITDITDPLQIYVEDKSRGSDYGD